MKSPMVMVGLCSEAAVFLGDWERIFQIPLTNPKMDDARRTIHEEANDLPLGNHYHRVKTEVFVIVEGELQKLITSDDEGNSRQKFLNLPAGTMILMPPRVAHTFFLAAGTKMVCYATELFDPNDMPALKLA